MSDKMPLFGYSFARAEDRIYVTFHNPDPDPEKPQVPVLCFTIQTAATFAAALQQAATGPDLEDEWAALDEGGES